ncbi:MAG: ABC transporter ATP-binding protein, partial [Schleiferilactobacillus harbinensis]|nr:ABC transporter ATP-binding protein [Schleiferilactobacillus harbinensis]
AQIDQYSHEEAKLQESMADPAALTDYKKMQSLQEQLTALQNKRHQAEHDWENKLTELDDQTD